MIFKNKTYKQLQKMVSSEYREIIPKSNECVSGLIFPDKVILANDVKKMMKRIDQDTDAKKIAIGYSFTNEAVDLLKNDSFNVFTISNFVWSDEDYKEVKGGDSKHY
ncbi:hypothetical protein [Niallia taxi]|uniref:hypothetical protein n=1 Tax=Niallia taxi TaxID=2499688 RepID=UPI002E24863F|nr:hypothetical protein [Niallia taxi]